MSKVTVLLPVHNGANFVESSLRSVLAQTHKDIELLVLDDCSSDNSAEIINAIDDDRVKYSRNSARFGLFKTLNRGFFEAKSSLVHIWAHDDLMLRNCIKLNVKFAEQYPSAGMIYSNFFEIDASGTRTKGEDKYHFQRQRTPILSGSDISAALFLCFGCLPGNISTVMLRKEIWEKTGGFIEGNQQAPDYDMWLRVSEFTDVGYIHEKLLELRNHPLQLAKIGQKSMTTIDEELPIFRELKRRLHNCISEKEIDKFWCHQRGRQHAHWIVRSFLRREVKTAIYGWHSLKKYGYPWKQLLFWLYSANGRYFTVEPEQFFDTLIKRTLFEKENLKFEHNKA